MKARRRYARRSVLCFLTSVSVAIATLTAFGAADVWLDYSSAGSGTDVLTAPIKTATGSIRVTSTPSGAAIWLDGADTAQTTEALIASVSTGSHAVRVVLAGYAPSPTEVVTVVTGQTANVDFMLIPPIWQGYQETGGWMWLNWFGYFNGFSGGWLYHLEHGWLYGTGSSPSSIWVFVPRAGWLWTGSATYPFFWNSGWLWYYRGTGNGAGGWFYNYAKGKAEWL